MAVSRVEAGLTSRMPELDVYLVLIRGDFHNRAVQPLLLVRRVLCSWPCRSNWKGFLLRMLHVMPSAWLVTSMVPCAVVLSRQAVGFQRRMHTRELHTRESLHQQCCIAAGRGASQPTTDAVHQQALSNEMQSAFCHSP